MSDKKYVFPHPINVFLIGDQGMPTEKFCSLYGFNQSRISMWITRERRVDELPVNFIYCLSLAAGSSMEDVYNKLLDYEVKYRSERRRKINIDE